MTTKETLIKAIKERTNVHLSYDGYERECSPHAIGYKNGTLSAIMYQFGGSTSSGRITSDTKDNWKCMKVEKMSNVALGTGAWHTFGNHSQPSKCIDDMIAEVEK